MIKEELEKQFEVVKENLMKDGWDFYLPKPLVEFIDEKGNECFNPLWHEDGVASISKEKEKYMIVISAWACCVNVVRKDGVLVEDRLFEPNYAGIGLDLKKYFKNDKELFSKDGEYILQHCDTWDSWYGAQLLIEGKLIKEVKLDSNDIAQILSENYLRKIIKDFDLE